MVCAKAWRYEKSCSIWDMMEELCVCVRVRVHVRMCVCMPVVCFHTGENGEDGWTTLRMWGLIISAMAIS